MLTLVLLPGMDGTGIQFEPFIRSLDNYVKTQTVAYPADEPLSYDELCAYVENLLPKQGIYILLGESFSGPIAIAIASEKPPGLVGLILCCSFVRNPLPKLARFKCLIGILPCTLPPNKILNYLLLGKYSTPHLFNTLKQALSTVSRQTLQTRLRAVLSVDVTAKLARLAIPILYLQADSDRLIPKTAGVLIKEIFPTTKLITLAGPHLLLQAQAGAAASSIRAFIDENQLITL